MNTTVRPIRMSTRLILGFSALVGLLALLGALAIYKVSGIQHEFVQVIDDHYPKSVLAGEVKAISGDVSQALSNLFTRSDPRDIAAQYALIDGSLRRTGAHLGNLEDTIFSAVGKAALEKLLEARAGYRQSVAKVGELLRSGQVNEARVAMVGELRPRQTAYNDRLDELIRVQQGLMTDSGADVTQAVASTKLSVGTVLVDQAGVTMQEVVTSIRRVTDIVGEISVASSEQSIGIGHVGNAVAQMDQATQRNAALVEESAAAAESLRVQAQHLVDAVAVFKLADSPADDASAG